jgi:hypothetical protein
MAFLSLVVRTGAVRAVQIILLRHCEEKKAQGIVASLKDSFGFIERADEASEVNNLKHAFCVSFLVTCLLALCCACRSSFITVKWMVE